MFSLSLTSHADSENEDLPEAVLEDEDIQNLRTCDLVHFTKWRIR